MKYEVRTLRDNGVGFLINLDPVSVSTPSQSHQILKMANFMRSEADRNHVLRHIRNTEEFPSINTRGFMKMFEKIKDRTDISHKEKTLVLDLLVSQAFLHLAKISSEIGYQQSLEDDRSSKYYGQVKYDYDSEYLSDYDTRDQPRDDWTESGESDCLAWFKNPNWTDKNDAQRYGVPLGRFSWVKLNIGDLTLKKQVLIESCTRDLKLQEGETSGIDELFNGSSAYNCFAWNPRPDLILLMRSVLHHVGELLKSYALTPTEACRAKIMKYLKTPYIAHLDLIYKHDSDKIDTATDTE